jgi:hypothetical protein
VAGADEAFDILGLLAADGPLPRLSDRLMLFGRLVGTWDMRVKFYDEKGDTTYDQPGTWSFSWAMDGRAVQDVLVYPNPDDGMSAEAGRRRIGTTVRWYDPKLAAWRVVWMGVVTGDVGVMTAREVGGEIWIELKEEDGSLTRWTFTEMTRESFHWKGLTSVDQGKTWRMGQEMLGTRRRARPP